MFTNLKQKVTSKVGLQILEAQRHSPVILFSVGAVGMLATVVMASRATLKMDEVIRESEEKKAAIEQALLLSSEERYTGEKYTEEDAKKDGMTTRVRLAIKIAKLYAPSIAIGLLSVGAMTGSHVILNRRYVGASAAFAGANKAFQEYRGRVVEELGKEKDQEFRYGVVEREVAVDDETGTHAVTIKERDPKSHGSMYARLFDEETSKNWEPEPGYNSMRIKAQMDWANYVLNGKGFLFLNEVYEMLGMDPSPEGQMVGWVKREDGGGDGHVDFCLMDDPKDGMEFICGNDSSVWLDFNVDGDILWILKQRKVEKAAARKHSQAQRASQGRGPESRRSRQIREG